MSLYQTVKSAITVRQVGEMYGMEPDRHGMVCCPFHSDNHPSMMLNDTYYYCFGCGANGDAIDLTAKLFDLNPRQAAEKLAHDFGINPDKPPANAIALPPPKRGLTDEQYQQFHWSLRLNSHQKPLFGSYSFLREIQLVIQTSVIFYLFVVIGSELRRFARVIFHYHWLLTVVFSHHK